MSRDGSGNYTRVPGSAYTNGTIADGAELDAEINDIATALTQSIAKDGQTVPTANLPMGGYKHTNVNTASARTEYARASQVQDGALTYLSSVSGADTITASAPIGLSAYAAGQEFHFVAAGDNTGAVTLNINSLGAKDVTKRGTTALASGDIKSGQVVLVEYDGTRFQVVSQVDDAVRRTGDQTIAGVKTFSSSPIVPAPTTGLQAANKNYADTVAATLVNAAVAPATLAPTLLAAISGTGISASGAAIDVPSIESWARRVTIVFQGLSVNGTSSIMVQIGDAGGIEASGYLGSSSVISTGVASTAYTTGFGLRTSADADVISGAMVLTRLSGNLWVASATYAFENAAATGTSGGAKTLTDTLTQIRITTVGGANLFDFGSINVLYE